MIARIKPGTERAQLVAQLEPLARRVQERLGGPAPYKKIMERHRPVVKPLREQMVGKIATPLWILLGTVAIVFLIACVNVANLFTVRAENRRNDLAVRRALGAGRGDLVRSQVTEALLLAAIGGAAGALLAWAGVPLLVRAAPDAVAGGFTGAPIPGLATATLDGAALLFTAGLSILAACLFGLLPALRVSRAGVGTLQQSGRGVVGGGSLTRDVLVGAQTAAALVLLVGSALLVRSFWQLSQVDTGYDTKGIFTFQIAAGGADPNNRAVALAVSVRLHGQAGGAAWRGIRGIHHHASAGRGRRQCQRHDAENSGEWRGGAARAERGCRRRLFPDDGDPATKGPLLRAHGGGARHAERHHQRDGCQSAVPRRRSAGPAGAARDRRRAVVHGHRRR